MKKEINISQEVTSAVSTIRSEILLSQERAVKAVNQEQLALYYVLGALYQPTPEIRIVCFTKHGMSWKLIRQLQLAN